VPLVPNLQEDGAPVVNAGRAFNCRNSTTETGRAAQRIVSLQVVGERFARVALPSNRVLLKKNRIVFTERVIHEEDLANIKAIELDQMSRGLRR
jgi:hypothetical protein